MSDHAPEAAPPAADVLIQRTRPARTLLGWLPPDVAQAILSGGRNHIPLDPATEARAAAAREAVSQREPLGDQGDLLTPPPPELASHIEALQAHERSAPMFAEGWQVAVVDLDRVIAFQPNIFVDTTEQRVSEVNADDPTSIASISLPLPVETHLPLQFDEHRTAWTISSPNPNLRIVGNFAGQPQPGAVALGFLISVLPSYMQVARFQGRYLLRDGYHRAYGLLQRGITRVPVFTRDYGTFQELAVPPGMLAEPTYLGDRPPTLADYFLDEVSADAELPASQKMIIVQGVELTPAG